MENHSEEQLKEIAGQLACPKGMQGIKTGEVMNENNIGMTHTSISEMNLKDGDVVLEIGHGNAAHLGFLLEKAKDITYFGADVSETMVEEAIKINSEFVSTEKAHFNLTTGKSLPFVSDLFNHIFTVNTIYFWQNPIEYLHEIRRVLKPDGTLILCFADRNFMKKLPFTPFGFKLYPEIEVKDLLKTAGFSIVRSIEKSEEVRSKLDEWVTRKYYTITAIPEV